MTKWEYILCPYPFLPMGENKQRYFALFLGEYGSDGWELVQLHPELGFIFKRKIEDQP